MLKQPFSALPRLTQAATAWKRPAAAMKTRVRKDTKQRRSGPKCSLADVIFLLVVSIVLGSLVPLYWHSSAGAPAAADSGSGGDSTSTTKPSTSALESLTDAQLLELVATQNSTLTQMSGIVQALSKAPSMGDRLLQPPRPPGGVPSSAAVAQQPEVAPGLAKSWCLAVVTMVSAADASPSTSNLLTPLLPPPPPPHLPSTRAVPFRGAPSTRGSSLAARGSALLSLASQEVASLPPPSLPQPPKAAPSPVGRYRCRQRRRQRRRGAVGRSCTVDRPRRSRRRSLASQRLP